MSLSSVARDALDDYGSIYSEGPLMWYCTWNGATYGPFANREAAVRRRMEARTGDALATAKFYTQFNITELQRELRDWKREVRESGSNKEIREAQNQVDLIEAEIARQRSGDRSLSAVARDALVVLPEQDVREHEAMHRALKHDLSGGNPLGKPLAVVARDALDCVTSFAGDPALERRYSGGDSLSAVARDALARDADKTSEGKQAGGYDSLADLVERARGGLREATGDAKFDALSARDQKLLIEHFKSEFNYSEKEAREALRDSTAQELKIHLEAAKEGYI